MPRPTKPTARPKATDRPPSAPGSPRLRVVDTGPGAPAWNMAVDQALLLAAEVPTLRFYRWQPHAVSLGHFQRLTDFADLPAGTPVVRRITGGGAIHHAEELTFSLALPAARLPLAIEASYVLVHDGIAAALAGLGVIATRLAAGTGQHPRPAQRWCFAEPGRHDLVAADGRKLLGSAQRRIHRPRAWVLHHGSLVLRRPALTPFAAAVADQVDPPPAEALQAAISRELAARLAAIAEPGGLSAAEVELAEGLLAQGATP